MNLDKIKLALRQLSYAEMVQLSKELASELPAMLSQNEHGAVAAALLALPLYVETGQTSPEEKILHKAFTRRRVISIKPHGNGFEISCESIRGAMVQHTSIREGVNMLLDNIVGIKSLE